MRAVIDHLRAHPIMAILRGVPAPQVLPLATALLAGGVRSLEVAFTDADAAPKIAALADAFGRDGSACVGAGTVTSAERAEAALEAGAAFLVTPHVAGAVITVARERGVPVVCGAATPTEVAQALEQGASFIKLFPAGPLGPGYLRALFGPYPDLEVFAVGGVGRDNARAFLDAGAIGLGVGGALTSLDWNAPDLESITLLARELSAIAANARGGRS
jgi:2-dehydro-3-deoxyphosphogluconate aldolase / (4S)-4-hydroxy-2-oxoglutarate aldolase